MHRVHLRLLSTLLCIMILSTNLLFAAPVTSVPATVTEEKDGSYRLSKYDVLNIVILGFGDSFLKKSSNDTVGTSGGGDMSATSTNQVVNLGQNDFMIGPDGYVNLPYAGSVKLSGLTIPEATKVLSNKLGEYIKIPQLSVMVKQYGPRKVYVVGEVTKQGVYSLGSEYMNVFAAISSAGGMTKRGKAKNIAVVRTIDGKVQMQNVNFERFVKKKDASQNVTLLDGDMVYVPRSNHIDLQEDVLPLMLAFGTYKSLTD